MAQRGISQVWLSLLLGLTSTAASASPSKADATNSKVWIGEVNVASDVTSIDGTAAELLGPALRSALNEELGLISSLNSVKRPIVLSATLVGMKSERRDEKTKATASISLVLRRADDQIIFAELRGHASAEEAAGNLATLRRAALQGAAHGALSRLPEAVRHSG
jgi:hypothetical protein